MLVTCPGKRGAHAFSSPPFPLSSHPSLQPPCTWLHRDPLARKEEGRKFIPVFLPRHQLAQDSEHPGVPCAHPPPHKSLPWPHPSKFQLPTESQFSRKCSPPQLGWYLSFVLFYFRYKRKLVLKISLKTLFFFFFSAPTGWHFLQVAQRVLSVLFK